MTKMWDTGRSPRRFSISHMTSVPLNSVLASSSCSLILPQSQKMWVSRAWSLIIPLFLICLKHSWFRLLKLPFRVVLSALCIVSASVCRHSALMITRITMTALLDREICTSGKWWSRHSNLLALKSTLVMIILSWLALCGDKVPLKAACVDMRSLSAFSPVTSSHPEWDHYVLDAAGHFLALWTWWVR